MRRFSVPRASTTVAVVAAIVAVLAVMFPGLGFGLSSTSHGGTPTDVYSTVDDEVCHGDRIGTEDVVLVPTTVQVGQQSHILALFGGMWSGFEMDSALLIRIEIFDGNGFQRVSPGFSVNNGQVHGSGTVMWTFENIPAGTYTVQAVVALFPEHGAFVPHGNTGHTGANVQNCALTLFVNPSVSP